KRGHRSLNLERVRRQYCSARKLPLTGVLPRVLEFFDMCQQFSLSRPPGEEQAEHLEGALGGFFAYPQTQQQAGDYRHIDLDGYPVGALTQQVPTAQDALEPAEKQLDLPAIMPPKREDCIRPRLALLRTSQGLLNHSDLTSFCGFSAWSI